MGDCFTSLMAPPGVRTTLCIFVYTHFFLSCFFPATTSERVAQASCPAHPSKQLQLFQPRPVIFLPEQSTWLPLACLGCRKAAPLACSLPSLLPLLSLSSLGEGAHIIFRGVEPSVTSSRKPRRPSIALWGRFWLSFNSCVVARWGAQADPAAANSFTQYFSSTAIALLLGSMNLRTKYILLFTRVR